jgi:hypothetical protein
MNIEKESYFVREEERAWGIALFESIIESGQGAQKSVFLTNGGAAVAVLALWGHLVTLPKGNPAWAIAPDILAALSACCIGVACAAFVTGITYVNQTVFREEMVGRYSIGHQNIHNSDNRQEMPRQRLGIIVQCIGTLFWILSLGAFIWGLVLCREGFQMFLKGMVS